MGGCREGAFRDLALQPGSRSREEAHSVGEMGGLPEPARGAWPQRARGLQSLSGRSPPPSDRRRGRGSIHRACDREWGTYRYDRPFSCKSVNVFGGTKKRCVNVP